jgi:hypothetical protein
VFDEEWPVRSVAMALYWAQRLHHAERGAYTDDLSALAAFTAP